MKTPPNQPAFESAPSKRDYNPAIVDLVDSLKTRLQAGEIIAATDYPASDRPAFWAAIAIIRDALPYVKPTWRTISEQHVDGIRTRQKMFRIVPRQRGVIDATLAGLIALAAVCAAMLIGGPL